MRLTNEQFNDCHSERSRGIPRCYLTVSRRGPSTPLRFAQDDGKRRTTRPAGNFPEQNYIARDAPIPSLPRTLFTLGGFAALMAFVSGSFFRWLRRKQR